MKRFEFVAFVGREVAAFDTFEGNLWSDFFYVDTHFMLEAKSEQSDLVGVREVETQAGDSASRSENWLSIGEGLKNYIWGGLSEIPTQQLPKDGSRHDETVAVPGESKASRALLLRTGKNYRKALPNDRINIQRSAPDVHFIRAKLQSGEQPGAR